MVPSMDSGLQHLPLDILLIIFEFIGTQDLITLSPLCRSFHHTSTSYLRYHPTISLTNSASTQHAAEQSIQSFFSQIAYSKPLALATRHVSARITHDGYNYLSMLPYSTRQRLIPAIRALKPATPEGLLVEGTGNDVGSWLLLALLMCANLETLTITTDRHLDWLRTAQRLDYTHWPHAKLRRLDICYTRSKEPYGSPHDLQDVWLLLKAPGLESLSLTGVRQGNNLYAGSADGPAIRTVYWPIDLEGTSLHHSLYLGERQRGGRRLHPLVIPAAPSKLPVTHGYHSLTKLDLIDTVLPETWFQMLLPCFTVLKHLRLSISGCGVPPQSWRGHNVPDLRSLATGIEALASTLESLVLDIQVPRWSIDWINAARTACIAIGTLTCMQKMVEMTLPWFTLLPPRADDDVSDDAFAPLKLGPMLLPPALKKITLTRCELAQPGAVGELIRAILPADSSYTGNTAASADAEDTESLKMIALQAHVEIALRAVEIKDLAILARSRGVELLLEKCILDEKSLVGEAVPLA